MLRNEKGLTLIEVLATLVITIILMGSLLALLQNTNAGINNVRQRETTQHQARDIVNSVVNTARKGVSASQSSINNLQLVNPNTLTSFTYRFNQADRTVELSTQPIDSTGALIGSPRKHIFSDKVINAKFELSESNTKIVLTLTMQLPNNQTSVTTNTVYTNLIPD